MADAKENEKGHPGDHPVVQVPVQYVYAEADEDEISLIDLLAALARQKFLVFWITLIFFLGSIGATFLLTPQYKTTATVTSNVAGSQIVELLKSRAVKDAVLDRFAPEDWREKTGLGKEMTREELEKEYIGEVYSESKAGGIVNIQVIYRDPARAAEIANAYVDVLENFFRKNALTANAERRLYFSKELEKARYKSFEAQEKFESLTGKHGVQLSQVSDDAFFQAAAHRALRDSKIIQMQGLSLMAPELDPKIIELKEEISKISRELAQMTETAPVEATLTEKMEIPEEAAVEFIERYYEMKYWEALHAALADLYERSLLEEAMNPAVIQVLDKALAPGKRFKPNRKLIVILATMLGFFIAIFSAFMAEFARRASEDPEQEEKIRMIKEAFNPMTYIRHVFRIR
ncbi:MAG: Lipopolysaccharide biosynthesis protein [Synergistales bacterium 53_16]|nr:MAG: Lipopolysaccharide biosynthesis protein [Synergistales bacterium 53_16]